MSHNNLVGGFSPTPLKNMPLIKLDDFPNFRDEKKRKPPPSNSLIYPLQVTLGINGYHRHSDTKMAFSLGVAISIMLLMVQKSG